MSRNCEIGKPWKEEFRSSGVQGVAGVAGVQELLWWGEAPEQPNGSIEATKGP